jgi:hypothetical protein
MLSLNRIHRSKFIDAKHGGVSQVTTRYVRAENSKSKIIRDYFNDSDFNEKYRNVMPYYLDCNQLYPSDMLYALPVGGYKLIPIGFKDGKWILDMLHT